MQLCMKIAAAIAYIPALPYFCHAKILYKNRYDYETFSLFSISSIEFGAIVVQCLNPYHTFANHRNPIINRANGIQCGQQD